MRVLLNRRPRQRNERGAIAIMVAASMVLLCVLGAFVVDFGQAYVNKNQAQSAADASVLAAAKIYSTQKGDCSSLLPGKRPDLYTDAENAADTLREQSLPKSTGLNFEVTCDTDEELMVDYDVDYDSPLGLGQLVTGDSTMTVERTATATFDRPTRGESGMRPWPICSNSINTTDTTVTQVLAGNDTNVGCPGIEMSGTWGRFACPGYAKGDGSDKDDKPTSSLYWIRYGCPNPASPIPDQPLDPSALRSYLVDYCAGLGKNDPSTEFCLTRDTGKAQNKKMDSAWQMVVDAGLTMEIPVFCAIPQCSSDAVTTAPVIPIYAIAVVRLCGVYLDGTHSNWSTSPECVGTNNPKNYSKTTATPGDKNAFYVVFKNIIKGDDGTTGGSSNLRLVK